MFKLRDEPTADEWRCSGGKTRHVMQQRVGNITHESGVDSDWTQWLPTATSTVPPTNLNPSSPPTVHSPQLTAHSPLSLLSLTVPTQDAELFSSAFHKRDYERHVSHRVVAQSTHVLCC